MVNLDNGFNYDVEANVTVMGNILENTIFFHLEGTEWWGNDIDIADTLTWTDAANTHLNFLYETCMRGAQTRGNILFIY